eukprot:CAMPEP_0170904510 /NCGR_PEP_ID=MMETSP0734-20130129/50488_1 /TAXON_ID=186038 /ORGANISM="Fragilariopsis kerguelensis, Strain L26-C5" /LENGTH=104 /DNA_ID=CAMNT_0011300067 /DNA_START=333 /DNA_END=647 /DNA_ORIENTATION=+
MVHGSFAWFENNIITPRTFDNIHTNANDDDDDVNDVNDGGGDGDGDDFNFALATLYTSTSSITTIITCLRFDDFSYIHPLFQMGCFDISCACHWNKIHGNTKSL